MRHNPPGPEELAEIMAELEALGEDPVGADEIGDAALLGGALDALRQGPDAVEALPQPEEGARARLEAPLAGMHRLRASTEEGDLDALRSEDLFAGLSEKLPAQKKAPERKAKVIPFPMRPGFQAFFAAAAAILLIVFLGFMGVFEKSFEPRESAPTATQQNSAPLGAVAQIELEEAETHLAQVEKRSLQALMAAQKAPTGKVQGDHYLRTLRQARSEAVRARRQARARRL